MTADLDEALAGTVPDTEAAVSLVRSDRKCRRHEWVAYPADDHDACRRCGAIYDPVASRRGRSSLARSKREERKLARDLGGRRTGHLGGPDDVQTGLLNVQSKAGTGWWSARYAAELDKLPRTGGRIPALVVSNGQPGHLVRRFVVVDYRDFQDLYGSIEETP